MLLAALSAAALLAALPSASGAPSPAAFTCAGAFTVNFDGAPRSWQVVTATSTWEHVASNGSTLSIAYNDRAYLVAECDVTGGVFSPAMFSQRLPMLGHSWSFTMDVSTASCGCNAALYAVSMPGLAADGSPAPSSGGDFYCDANQVGGTWCTEMDLIEANSAAMAATPHACAAPTATGYVPQCDKGGCGLGTKGNATLFGAGAGYVIDTRRAFDVVTSFPVDAQGALAAVTTLVRQGAASFSLDHTPAGCGSKWNTATMTAALAAGMVPTFSLWGGTTSGSDMAWLDSPPCAASQGCGGDGTIALFSNFAVTTL